MTLFTDNPFEKDDDTETGLRQRGKSPPVPYPPLRGLPATRGQSPCVGYCLKQDRRKKTTDGTIKRRNL